MTRDRHGLLFLSPIVPDIRGVGITMRAALHLDVLAAMFDVHLVVVAKIRPQPNDVPDSIKRACRSVTLFHADSSAAPTLSRLGEIREPHLRALVTGLYPVPMGLAAFHNRHLIDVVAAQTSDCRFQAIHAFRLSMAPYAVAIIARLDRPPNLTVIYLDDFESKKARRSLEFVRQSLSLPWYWLGRLEAFKYVLYEKRHLPRFDRILVCSGIDRIALGRHYSEAAIRIVPNGIPSFEATAKSGTSGEFRFLFVGTMNYEPNRDAVRFFCNDVLPVLRTRAPGPFSVVIVGRNPPESIRALGNDRDVLVAGDVEDVADYYRDADAVIAPLRMGGGTRIKILEAFGQKRPVVSSAIGAEGLDVENGRDILLAETPTEIAAACVALMTDTVLRDRLAANAHRLLTEKYDEAAIARALREVYGDVA